MSSFGFPRLEICDLSSVHFGTTLKSLGSFRSPDFFGLVSSINDTSLPYYGVALFFKVIAGVAS